MSGPLFPSADECLIRLKRAGWSVGEASYVAAGSGEQFWVVTGHNGENQVRAHGATRAEAWWWACEQAKAVGMLGRGA